MSLSIYITVHWVSKIKSQCYTSILKIYHYPLSSSVCTTTPFNKSFGLPDKFLNFGYAIS